MRLSTLLYRLCRVTAPGGAARGCTCARSGGSHPILADLLSYSSGGGTRSATWRAARLSATNGADLDTAACIVADAAIAWRAVGAPDVHALWAGAVLNGSKLGAADAELVGVFLDHAFGLPNAPRDERHRYGWLAEFVFYLIAERVGSRPGRTMLRVEGPDWHATKPGRDSLAVWKRADGTLEFRLWESKQSTGATAVSSSVSEATTQLSGSALSYLAQATGVAAAAGTENGSEVRVLYGQLPRLWMAGDPRSGIGISVTTAETKIPNRCFSRVSRSFPLLTSPNQIEGLVAGIADFAAFADTVRDRAWMPL